MSSYALPVQVHNYCAFYEVLGVLADVLTSPFKGVASSSYMSISLSSIAEHA